MAIAWALLHVALGGLYLGSAGRPQLYITAMALYLVIFAAAIWPLKWPAANNGTLVDWSIASGAVIVECMTVWSLRTGAVDSYANWSSGACSLLIAALVFRSHAGLAALAAAGVVMAQTFAAFAKSGSQEVDIAGLVFLAVPPVVWLLASLGVSRDLRRGRLLTADLDRRTVGFVDDAQRAGRDEVSLQRAERLEVDILPFLTGVTNDSPAVRRTASELAASLRDDLHAKHLIDHSVREAVFAARRVGVKVTLTSESAAGAAGDQLRTILPNLLSLEGLLSLTAWSRPSGSVVVLEDDRALDDNAVRQLIGGSGSADRIDESLIVRLLPYAE